MSDDGLDLLRGTLDLLILKALDTGPLHGYALSKWVKTASREMLVVEARALSIALHRHDARKLIRGAWHVTETGRRARRYELTPAGRKRLLADREYWKRYVQAMNAVLRTGLAEEPA